MATQPIENEMYAADAPEASEAPEPAPAPAPEPTPEDEAPAEGEQLEEQQADDEGDAEQEPEAEPIPAPRSWAKDAKEQFATLPREMQEIISKRETERDRFAEQKATEAQNAKQTAAQEARQAVLQIHRAHADRLQEYASMFEVQAPDIRLLQTGDEQHRALYYQQDAAYKHATAQREQAQREADQSRQQSEALEQQSLREQAAQELAILQEQVPEWSEPSERAKLLTSLESIGAELGYSPEQMVQARASDILALRKASEWKAKAEKLDQLNKRKMEPVRAARQLPPVARPGVPGAARPQQDVAAMMYPNDVRK